MYESILDVNIKVLEDDEKEVRRSQDKSDLFKCEIATKVKNRNCIEIINILKDMDPISGDEKRLVAFKDTSHNANIIVKMSQDFTKIAVSCG